MGRCRVVRPETVRLQLTEGDYIDVKKELTAGEYQTLIANVTPPKEFGAVPSMDSTQLGMQRALAFLVGWSFVGLDDQPLPYSPELPENLRLATLRSLDADTFMEIVRALDAHEAQVDREKKRARTPEPASVSI